MREYVINNCSVHLTKMPVIDSKDTVVMATVTVDRYHSYCVMDSEEIVCNIYGRRNAVVVATVTMAIR